MVSAKAKVVTPEEEGEATYSLEEIRDMVMGWKCSKVKGTLKFPETIEREKIEFPMDLVDFLEETFPEGKVEVSEVETTEIDPE
jgi:hypothetical protein